MEYLFMPQCGLIGRGRQKISSSITTRRSRSQVKPSWEATKVSDAYRVRNLQLQNQGRQQQRHHQHITQKYSQRCKRKYPITNVNTVCRVTIKYRCHTNNHDGHGRNCGIYTRCRLTLVLHIIDDGWWGEEERGDKESGEEVVSIIMVRLNSAVTVS